MRLFVYEHVSASSAPLESSLRREGLAMLSALVEDFAGVEGVEVSGIVESDMRARGEEAAFRAQANRADATLVIAPEFDNLLAQRSQWAVDEGSVLLGAPLEAIRRASDKVSLCATLCEHQVATPPVYVVGQRLDVDWDPWPKHPPFPCLLKPRFGAGCRGIRLVHTREGLSRHVDDIPARERASDWFVQPLIPGLAASVAFLVGEEQTLPLVAGRQHVTATEEGLCYEGGTLPLPGLLQERAVALAGRALRCFPALRGFVGVDLILGEADNGSQDHVIEVNPRVTTSYVGLRRICRENLAGVWWALHRRERVAEPGWQARAVRFQADGRVEYV